MLDSSRHLILASTLLLSGLTLSQATAQTSAPAAAPAANLTFDVASVRPAAPIDQATIFAGLRAGKRPEVVRIEGQRATFTYNSLKGLIAYGYKVREYQVTGPDWLATDRFDITANLPEGTTRDDVPVMLKALLAERFKLAAHLATTDQPVLGLMIAKGGAKLNESSIKPETIDESVPLRPGETKMDTAYGPIRLLHGSDGSTTYNLGVRGAITMKVDGETGTMHMSSDDMTMRGLADMLTTLGGGAGRQVVDQTGLAGSYVVAVDFSLRDLISSLRDSGIEVPVRRGGGGEDPTGETSIAEALARQGLKLAGSKAMIQQLIVDHVEKDAEAN